MSETLQGELKGRKDVASRLPLFHFVRVSDLCDGALKDLEVVIVVVVVVIVSSFSVGDLVLVIIVNIVVVVLVMELARSIRWW